jgi:hypothetical protein
MHADPVARDRSGDAAVIARIANARRCVAGKGLRVIGGPVLPAPPPGSSSPDGELIVGSAATDVFIAFYTDADKAQRLQAGVVGDARRLGGRVERHGAATVLWMRPPASGLRTAMQACGFG